jgi:hypothetical protein
MLAYLVTFSLSVHFVVLIRVGSGSEHSLEWIRKNDTVLNGSGSATLFLLCSIILLLILVTLYMVCVKRGGAIEICDGGV